MNRPSFALAVIAATFTASAAAAQTAPVVSPSAVPAASPPTTAVALAAPPPAPAPAGPPLVELHGYLQPQFGVRYRPQALSRDRWEYGGLSSRAGLIVSGSPVSQWSYVVHLSLDARSLVVLAGLDLVDSDGDGAIDKSVTSRRSFTGTLFEEATIAYDPFDFLTLKLGAMRMPFTVALRSSNTALLFPTRPGANEIFQSGADQGALVHAHFLDGVIEGSLGAFTGTSLGLVPAETEARGLVYSLRVDAAPLGRLPRAETDFERGPFRFGVGVGGLYRSGSLYANTGYELADLRDVRASASVRVAGFGLFVQAEGLRRVQTDSVGSRPNQATGGYVQGSFYVPLGERVGLAPIGRVGASVEDETTLPRRTVYYEGGVALFPRADLPRPETLRVLVQYQGERRVTDDESAHGVVAQAQLLF